MAAVYNFPVGTDRKDPNFQKILQMIASYRGYDNLEDLRAADRQVRETLAAQVKKTFEASMDVRKQLLERMHLQTVPDFDRMVGNLREAYEKLRRGNPKIAICHVYVAQKEAVSELYTVDYKMLSNAENVFNLMQEFRRMVREDMILGNIFKMNASVQELLESMDKKEQIISCMIA